MKAPVIDSSAILAILLEEAGAEKAMGFLANGVCCSVNVGEVIARLIDKGAEVEVATEMFLELGLEVVPFDEDLGVLAGQLRAYTKHRGLSLGDRACLALAVREKATAVTADRAWADLDLGIGVELIRQ